MDREQHWSEQEEGQLKCQGCASSQLERVLDLGLQPLCNEFVPISEATRPQTFYPLCLCYCHECTLVQLDYVIPTKHAFGDQYTYLTGSSKPLVDYYSQLARRLVDRFGLQSGDAVVEIGSNDGTFLSAFRSLGMESLGVEGARQASSIARANAIPVIDGFFGKGSASQIRERLPKGSNIRLILAMNVLAHTDNINEFLPEVVELMGPDTTFVSQSHWLAALVRNFEFDTVYHEHLRYYTLESLMNLFARHGLRVFGAETNDFYGGSILAYADTSAGGQLDGLEAILKEERGLDLLGSLKGMKKVLLSNKSKLLGLLVELNESGKRVVGVGAPMKASTLLNYYGITPDLVECIGEVNHLKVGTVVPGVGIPVMHEDDVFQHPPDYALLLSWNMADHIIPNLRAKGYRGKFVLPVPEVKVLE